MRATGAAVAAAVCAAALGSPAAAQQPPAGADAAAAAPGWCAADALYTHGLAEHGGDFARVAELAGAAPLRSWLIQRPAELRDRTDCRALATTPWGERLGAAALADRPLLASLPVGAGFHYNSGYPRSRNNGALWAGRGRNLGVHAGVQFAYGPLSATFAPIVWYQENRDFAIKPHAVPGASEWAYVGHLGLIDWPQRHGDESFSTFDLGQSQVSVGAAGFVTGFSTENLWWGPARRNPLLMSSTAPGVPRFFIGTSRPIDLRVATIEADLFWGVVHESDYYDDDPDNDRQLFSGMAIVVQPRPLEGLYLGFARSYLNRLPPDGLPLSEILLRPYRGVRANPQAGELRDNQLASLFARWALPAAGFEVYVEWGREDHWWDLTDLITEPDHAQAYMLGFQKVFTTPRRWVRLAGELTHLQAAYPYRGGRFVQTWYVHSVLRQGYTHRGQLIGAPIGPGSDAQYIGVDVFDRRGLVGGFVERTRYDDDAYFNSWGRYYGMHGHDVELTAGARQVLQLRDFDASWQLSYSWRRNRNFVGLDGGSWDLPTDSNIALRVGLIWRPGLRLHHRASMRAAEPVMPRS